MTKGQIPLFGDTNQTEEPATRSSSFWLTQDQYDWMDRVVLALKIGGWRGVNRSALLRSMMTVVMSTPLDLTEIKGERELTERLTAYFKAPSP